MLILLMPEISMLKYLLTVYQASYLPKIQGACALVWVIDIHFNLNCQRALIVAI
jgi:hypothetical protein